MKRNGKDLLATDTIPDLIGYEWEDAKEAARQAGWRVQGMFVGGDVQSEHDTDVLWRVIRQVRGDQTLHLTVAPEKWILSHGPNSSRAQNPSPPSRREDSAPR